MSNDLLNYLEKCDLSKPVWAAYVKSRGGEVKAEIASLRRYAGKQPGKIADYVNEMATAKQKRLDALLARCVKH